MLLADFFLINNPISVNTRFRRPLYVDGSSPVAKTGTVSNDAAGDLLVICPI
jgi:hypothetical protein